MTAHGLTIDRIPRPLPRTSPNLSPIKNSESLSPGEHAFLQSSRRRRRPPIARPIHLRSQDITRVVHVVNPLRAPGRSERHPRKSYWKKPLQSPKAAAKLG